MNFLLSYYYFSEEEKLKAAREVIGTESVLLLDSGAYSASSLGAPIHLSSYIDFCKRTQGIWTNVFNLDVIGDAHTTLKNQLLMEEAGLNPIPVFHLGDPWEYLEFYIANYDYIGLGGLAGKHTSIRVPFLDRCFEMVAASVRKPRFHGLGCTSWNLICRYPWKSVDSSTWTVGVRFNRFEIFHPQMCKIKPFWFSGPLGPGSEILKYGYLVRAYGFSTYDLVQPSRDRYTVLGLAMASWYEAEKYRQRQIPDFKLCLANSHDKDVICSLKVLRNKGYNL